MYIIANAGRKAIYEEALLSPTPNLGVRLQVYYAKGAHYTVTKDKIITTGLNVLQQATNTNAFNLGSCCIETLSIETSLDAPGIKGSRTSVTQFVLELGYGTTSSNIVYIPIGRYRMQSKSCSRKNGHYQLKLQSYMAALDKNLPRIFNYGTGTVQMWLEWLCTKIKVRNVAGTESDEYLHLSDDMNYSKLANQDFSFEITNETGYSTYRDILKDLCTISGAFATFDRDGGLLLVPFRSKTSVDGNIKPDSLISLSENLNKFSVDQIRCVSYKDVTDEEGKTTQENIDYSYPADVSTDDYYDISGLKIFNAMADRTIAAGIATRLFGFIGDVNYDATPFDAIVNIPDFRIDLGDWIEVESREVDDSGDLTTVTRSAQIMKIEYSVPGTGKFSSYQNPSNNDQNASQRSSYTSPAPSTPSGGGTAPTVVTEATAQWTFAK